MTDRPAEPFHDLDGYVALPRLAGLALSPDGARLVTSVAGLNPERTKWVSSLWEIDPTGRRQPSRLTRSAPGEGNAEFLPDGTLLFTSSRPDPDEPKSDDKPIGSLWALPAGGGEARLIASHPGGITGLRVARDSGTVVFAASSMAGAQTPEAETEQRSARREAGVTAILFEDYPVRHWDHDLGPARDRIYALADGAAQGSGPTSAWDADPAPRDVTPELLAVQSIEDYALSPDGAWVAVVLDVPAADASRRQRIDVIDVRTGERRTVADSEDHDFSAARFSPDGSALVCIRHVQSSWSEPADSTLWLVDLVGGNGGSDLTPTFAQWPADPVWSPDGSAVYFRCDEAGHHPVFRVELTGDLTRLTRRGSFSDVRVHPDGRQLFALRSTIDAPMHPVALDCSAPEQDPEPLPNPGSVPVPPGSLTEISTVAQDGATVRSWLVLPPGASATDPAPLLLWIHGGPLMSWNAWSWRWNPWLMAARGYAVLLPDPALSAGYGQDFVRRGWGAWGGAPYTDLMAITDEAEARPDIDATRTAAMGGSFGGYMANWVAGHTNRFQAIVTHASLWQLDQFSGTTDSAHYWAREFGDPLHQRERYEQNSPHLAVAQISTPMLVIHGDKDYRVPIGEGLRLWYDLRRHGVESKFLYFPDENHWVLTPGNAKVWSETVLAFLAQHVLGEKWIRPELV
ncbi:MAG: S9 family peptidase, partial [Geodermatophilaceae bacterium]